MISDWLGSKATCPSTKIGGYQGRELKQGIPGFETRSTAVFDGRPAYIPQEVRPRLSEHWDIMVMAGPLEEGYPSSDDIRDLCSDVDRVSQCYSRRHTHHRTASKVCKGRSWPGRLSFKL
jgi:allophanate hydrolase subunit 2